MVFGGIAGPLILGVDRDNVNWQLGCVGIVAPFGHKPEKKTDRFRRGKQGFGGVDFWRGCLFT